MEVKCLFVQVGIRRLRARVVALPECDPGSARKMLSSNTQFTLWFRGQVLM